MYETPLRANSRSRKSTSGAPPPLNMPPPPPPPGSNPKIAGGIGTNINLSSSSVGRSNSREHVISTPISPISSNGIPSGTMNLPQTPQQRLMLRKPMSMQTLSTVRSSSRLSMTPRGSVGGSQGETYKGKIHVGVRACPSPPSTTWFLRPESDTVEHESAGDFKFDKVYGGSASNSQVFAASVEPLIQQVTEGFNATVFAYGTTGSGKTYTMQGVDNDPGVIPRSVTRLFDMLAEKTAGGPSAEVRLSYFEIYNERVYDLLSAESNKPNEVMLRDGSDGDTRVVGQREVDTRSSQELLNWVAAGDQLRRTSSTQYNEHSSRSHAVVRVHIMHNGIQSVLYLCDLAGSERAVIHSERRKEGSYINKSLLTLSSVISILSQGGGAHVPYRDSKLTRLLQPSLSGTALVSMLCTIQTAIGGAETLNSIRFAAKAKNITVMAKRNSVFDDVAGGVGGMASMRLVEQLQLENESLRRESDKLRTERDDLQDRLDVFESADNSDAEASIEAMTGISFNDDDNDGQNNPQGKRTNHMQRNSRLTKELDWYKSENEQLHQRVSHLVAEISALDANIAHLESVTSNLGSNSNGFASNSSGTANNDGGAADKNGGTTSGSGSKEQRLSSASSVSSSSTVLNSFANNRAENVAELKEQIKDKDMIIACLTKITEAEQKVTSWQSNLSGDDSVQSAIDAVQELRI